MRRWMICEKTETTDGNGDKITLYPVDADGKRIYNYTFLALGKDLYPDLFVLPIGTILAIEFMQPAVTEPEPQHV